MDCSYCGCAVEAHDPVSLSTEPAGEPTSCNDGCLAAHIDTANLTTDTACNWSPAE